jgi:hypothetical protein
METARTGGGKLVPELMVNREGFTPSPLSITIPRPEDRMEGFYHVAARRLFTARMGLGIEARILGKKSR